MCWWPSPLLLNITLGPDSVVAGGETLLFNGGVISTAGVASFMPVSSYDITPRKTPPALVSAQMSSTGATVVVLFDRPGSGTLLGAAGAANCYGLVLNSNLGDTSTCAWTTPTTITITLGVSANSSLVVPSASMGTLACPNSAAARNDVLLFRSGVIVAVTGSIVSMPASCVHVQPPAAPVAPVIDLTAPQSVGSCDDIVIDASNTVDISGRGLSFNWTLIPMNAAAIASGVYDAFVSGRDPMLTSATLSFNNTALTSSASYNFSLSVSNFFGVKSYSWVTVTVASAPLPKATIAGPVALTTLPSRALTLTAEGTFPTCQGSSSDKSLGFRWTLVTAAPESASTPLSYVKPLSSGLPSLSSFVTNNPAVIVLPNLQVGVMYVVVAEVYVKANATLSNFASVSISVASGGITARIAGGDRQVGSETAWNVSALSSVDNDNITEAAFAYAWSCSLVVDGAVSGSPCQDVNGTALDFTVGSPLLASSGAVAVFQPGVLLAGVYSFTVLVSKGTPGAAVPAHYRSSTASVTVTVLAGAPPTIVVDTSAIPAKVNPTDRVRLAVSVDGHGSSIRYAWSSPSLSSQQFDAIRKTPDLTKSFIVIQPALTPALYTFVLTATNADNVFSQATVSVNVNGPPRNGFLEAVPRGGMALTERYTFSALKWNTEVRPSLSQRLMCELLFHVRDCWVSTRRTFR